MKTSSLIRGERRRQGWSQRQLAERAHVPQSTVARVETNAIDPRSRTVERLARALGCELTLEPILGVGVDRTLIHRFLELSPRERIEYAAAAGRAGQQLRAAFKARSH